MLFTISALLFVAVFLFLYILLFADSWHKIPEDRLKLVGPADQVKDELASPLYERLVQPVITNAGDFLMRLTPGSIRAMFESKLAAAGGFHGMSIEQFLVFCGLFILILTAVFTGVTAFVIKLPGNQVFASMLIGMLIGLLTPVLLLDQRAAARRAAIQKALPDVLDLLSVSVEAGLAFDGALSKVTEAMRGPLVDELQRMLQEIRMGLIRRTALRNLAERCNIPDLSLFTAALVQADQLGVPIAKVLQAQSDIVREKKRLTVRELAMKTPVKLLFPLVFFIFPTLFIVLLGPAAISIINTLGGR